MAKRKISKRKTSKRKISKRKTSKRMKRRIYGGMARKSIDWSNEKQVLKEVKKDGMELWKASTLLKNNIYVVAAATNNNSSALRYAGETLTANQGFMLWAVKKWGHALLYASDALKADKEVVRAAVMKNGMVLKHADRKLKKDKETAMKAVEEAWEALEYTICEDENDNEIWDDCDDILRNIAKAGLLAEIEAGHLPHILKALKFGYVSSPLNTFTSDKEVVLMAVERNGNELEYASPELQGNREVVLAAVNKNGSALEFASPELKRDIEVIWAAVQQNPEARQYAVVTPILAQQLWGRTSVQA